MTAIRKPYFWSRLSWHQRAAYLCSSNQARSYSEACSILAQQPRKRTARVPAKDPATYRWDLRN